MNAARVLKTARRQARLTQRALAELAGVPQSTVARIEAGHIDPRASTLDRLLGACGRRLRPEPLRGQQVDRSLIRQQLALTPRERIQQMAQAAAAVERLRGAARDTR